MIAHLRLAGLRIHPQEIERTDGVVDCEGRGCLPGELAKRYGALKLRLVLVTIDELVNIADGDSHVELARNRASGVARRGHPPIDRQIAGASWCRRNSAGKIPANHLFVERHSDSVGQLHLKERLEQRVGRHFRLRHARQHVIAAELAPGLGMKQTE